METFALALGVADPRADVRADPRAKRSTVAVPINGSSHQRTVPVALELSDAFSIDGLAFKHSNGKPLAGTLRGADPGPNAVSESCSDIQSFACSHRYSHSVPVHRADPGSVGVTDGRPYAVSVCIANTGAHQRAFALSIDPSPYVEAHA